MKITVLYTTSDIVKMLENKAIRDVGFPAMPPNGVVKVEVQREYNLRDTEVEITFPTHEEPADAP